MRNLNQNFAVQELSRKPLQMVRLYTKAILRYTHTHSTNFPFHTTADFTNRIWIKVVIRTKERMEWLKVL